MIYELRMYTCRQGTIPAVLEASGTVARRIRGGDDYGVLEGHFSSEIGKLNQYIHLWAYDSVEEMLRLRGELMAKPEWTAEYVPLIRPHILTQKVTILNPVLPMKPVEGEGHLYELRRYRLQPGKAAAWTAKLAEHMPAREKYSTNLGLWTTLWPDPNVVVHLWIYDSYEARMEARAAAQADPEWKEFLGFAGPQIEEMYSMLLKPSPYSPRK